MIIIYDGTLEGLMTSFFYCFKNKYKPKNIIFQNNISLFDKIINIETNSEKSKYMIEYFDNKIKRNVKKTILYTYASNFVNKEIYLFNYLLYSINNDSRNLNNEYVFKINEICRKVGLEIHRLKGLIRFRLLKDNSYYSPIYSDNDVIYFLIHHFVNRFKNEKIVLHDVERKNIAVCENNKIDFFHIKNDSLNDLKDFYHKDEFEIQNLWKEFHKSIAITNRKNTKLQKQFMPYRYWKYLIEL